MTQHSISRVGTLFLAIAISTMALIPACQSYRHIPPPEAGSTSHLAGSETSPVASTVPESSSPLVGRWSTLSWVGEVEVMIELTIRSDGTVLLRRTPQDTLIAFEAGGQVVDGGSRITMDDGVTLGVKLLQDHLVTTDPLNGLETVYKRR